MVAFPIPSALAMLNGITDKASSGRIRSSVDAGPPLQRQRYTARSRALGVPCALTQAERATFDAFEINDLENGTLPFDWIDPVTGSTVSMRLTDDVAWTFVAGENPMWTATLPLEIMP